MLSDSQTRLSESVLVSNSNGCGIMNLMLNASVSAQWTTPHPQISFCKDPVTMDADKTLAKIEELCTAKVLLKIIV